MLSALRVFFPLSDGSDCTMKQFSVNIQAQISDVKCIVWFDECNQQGLVGQCGRLAAAISSTNKKDLKISSALQVLPAGRSLALNAQAFNTKGINTTHQLDKVLASSF